MMHDKTLYIHIGCHKTGTTSIQQTLSQNEKALETYGIRYYCSNYFTQDNKPPNLHSWLCFDRKKSLIPKGQNIREPEKLAQKLAGLGTDVIVSSENFSFVFQIAELERLQQALSKYFPHIKVICYIRRQDQHLVSHHQEGSKLKRRSEYDLFGHSGRALPEYESRHTLYLDYHQRLSMWADAFGDENMVIRVFEREKLKGGDVVKDFFGIIGVREYDEVGKYNKSRGFHKTKLGHIINNSNVNHKVVLSRILMPNLENDSPMLPSRSEAMTYYSHYIASNKALNERFNVSGYGPIFSDDFDIYPELPADCWSEESANELITEIVEIVDTVYGDLNAKTLVDAALLFEDTDIQTSLKLMNIAHKLRPQGKRIVNKLEQYRKIINA